MWIKRRTSVPAPEPCRRLGFGACLCLALVLGGAGVVCAGEAAIASKQNREVYISLLSKSGRLDARDEYCALFTTKKGEAGKVEVYDVVVDFAQQVGKIRERSQEFPFSREGLGRYCGKVDLGQQYYRPAFYWVTVRYRDGSRKRMSCRFFLTMGLKGR